MRIPYFVAILFVGCQAFSAEMSQKDKFLAMSHFVTDDVFEKIYQLAVKYQGKDDQERAYASELQNLYCNGTTPRFIVKKSVVFTPGIPAGIALDYANEQSMKQMEMAKFFFKQDFLYASGWGKDVSQYLLRRGYTMNDSNSDSTYISGSDYQEFFFKNRQLSLDMGFLIKHFTFKIPKDLTGTMYRSSEDALLMDKFGYSSGEFKSSEAINFKDYIWRYVLIHDTQVKQSLKDSGTVFEMNWTPTLFCKYGMPLPSLKSI